MWTPGIHLSAQFTRRERVITGEVDFGNVDLGAFRDGEGSDFGIVRPGLFAIVDGDVGIALARVCFLDRFLGFVHASGIHDRAWVQLHRGDYLVVGGPKRIHPGDLYIGHLGPLGDLVDQDFLAVLIAGVGSHITKKAHLINGLDVVTDGVTIERLPRPLRNMQPNRVGFDALITFDLNVRDYRILGARDGAAQRQQQG